MHAQLSDSPPQKVTLKTWGGRDVNVTSKMARQLLEAEVLTGLVKNLKVRPTPASLSLSLLSLASLPRLSPLPFTCPRGAPEPYLLRGPLSRQSANQFLSHTSSYPSVRGRTWCRTWCRRPRWPRRRASRPPSPRCPSPSYVPCPGLVVDSMRPPVSSSRSTRRTLAARS